MKPDMVQAGPEHLGIVSSILNEAAAWLVSIGEPMWESDEIGEDELAPSLQEGLTYLAVLEGEPAGTIRFQLSDPLFWPELTASDSAFLHRLAVRRRAAGSGLSSAMIDWAAARARTHGRRWLRLDCDLRRPRLRAFYERSGFRFHSEAQVGRFLVARYEMAL